jgi:hypothetical protein
MTVAGRFGRSLCVRHPHSATPVSGARPSRRLCLVLRVREHSRVADLTPGAMDELLGHDWPGTLRKSQTSRPNPRKRSHCVRERTDDCNINIDGIKQSLRMTLRPHLFQVPKPAVTDFHRQRLGSGVHRCWIFQPRLRQRDDPHSVMGNPTAPAPQRDDERRRQHDRAADHVQVVDPGLAAAQHRESAGCDLKDDDNDDEQRGLRVIHAVPVMPPDLDRRRNGHRRDDDCTDAVREMDVDPRVQWSGTIPPKIRRKSGIANPAPVCLIVAPTRISA